MASPDEGGPPPGATARLTAATSSMPPRFVTGRGQGLQLFFHGLCAFVQPKSGSPLRVAMLNGYPDDAMHRHYASLVVPRQGVDIDKSTARPSAVDYALDHAIYSLFDTYVTLTVDGVGTPSLKVKKSVLSQPHCAQDSRWADFGWILDMSQFFTGPRRAWDKVQTVSYAQFEAMHGSLEQDFNGMEQRSSIDARAWTIGGSNRILKQAARLRILDKGPVTLELKVRSTGAATKLVLATETRTVNAGIIHLPVGMKMKQNPGVRLDDALAYYQMQDPSPLNPATDSSLKVPLWTNKGNCDASASVECACCPPSEV